jgi:hypothetical protein
MQLHSIQKYIINAGHGQLTQDGYCVIDHVKQSVINKIAPFSVHDEAVEMLRAGYEPEMVIKEIYQHNTDETFFIDIEPIAMSDGIIF